METVSFALGNTIIKEGEAIRKVYILSSGSVMGSSGKGEIFLRKGDIPAIFDFSCGYSFYTYTALEPVTCFCYELPAGGMQRFLKLHPELAPLFADSILRQVCDILDNYTLQRFNCDTFYRSLIDNHLQYVNLCRENHIIPKELNAISSLEPFYISEDIPEYLGDYYETYRNLPGETKVALFNKKTALSIGFLEKTSDDIHKIFECVDAIHNYQSDSAQLLLNSQGSDLFDLYTSLSFQLQKKKIDTLSINATIGKLIIQMDGQPSIDSTLYKARIAQYHKQLDDLARIAESEDSDYENDVALSSDLSNATMAILEYAEYPEERIPEFLKDLEFYTNTSDRSSTDSEINAVRKRLTTAFYDIYMNAFLFSVHNPPSLPVRMFLYFGFISAELAGKENTMLLSELAQYELTDPIHQIYTLYDWLFEIYNGKQSPSRNEFDCDYYQYLHELRYSGKISESDEASLRDDSTERVLFELRNVFPIVNKVTTGRISNYCPFFSEHNCLRSPSEMHLSPDKIREAIRTIQSIDYRAFYREVSFPFPEADIQHEYIQVEMLPNIILLPNIGARGSMWQEIEGKYRNTSSRMFFPLLCSEDFLMLFTRTTAEYRWEMCKRVQGSRWNDISDASLTSEYFDYVQFYRKNSDLSPDAKEKVKLSLQKSKNSFREMFVRDYMVWIHFEATGSPRLNKVARKILFKYCPFSASKRSVLDSNPIFKDSLNQYRMHTAQELHRLNNIFKKIENAGLEIPEEFKQQKRFLES